MLTLFSRRQQLTSADQSKVNESRRTANESCGTSRKESVPVFRSTSQTPVGLLTALDDGSWTNGEQWRIRTPFLTIGRCDADCVIPNDPGMSARHASIRRTRAGNDWSWTLEDSKSTNGVFIRTRRSRLNSGNEFQVGIHRLCFEHGECISSQDADAPVTTLRNPLDFNRQQATPRLVYLNGGSTDSVVLLKSGRNVLGCSADADVKLQDDPYCNLQHATVQLDMNNRWIIEDCNSVNGTWKRVRRVQLKSGSEFMLGSQRFRFDVL